MPSLDGDLGSARSLDSTTTRPIEAARCASSVKFATPSPGSLCELGDHAQWLTNRPDGHASSHRHKSTPPRNGRASKTKNANPKHYPALDLAPRVPGKHFPSNPSAADHLMFLHGHDALAQGQTRWVSLRRLSSVGNRYSGTTLPPLSSAKLSLHALLEQINTLVTHESDVYLAQSDFFWGKRGDPDRHRSRKDYLNSTGVLFCDLDTYNQPGLAGLSPGEISNQVLLACQKQGLPAPLTISSGRGLYAYWKLSERIDLKDPSVASRWSELITKAMSALAAFGPDPKVRDATRVLRLIGSLNSKSKTRVQVLHDDGASYGFEALEAAFAHIDGSEYRAANKTLRPGKDKAAPQSGAGDLLSADKKTKTSTQTNSKRSAPAAHTRDPHATKASDPKGDTAARALFEAPPEALNALRGLLERDQPYVQAMNPQRRFHYGLFHDISQVILARKGIAHGTRDEFLFWLLTTRYNAGLYSVNELAQMSALFAPLTEDALDVYQSGMLSSLASRMAQQEATCAQSSVRPDHGGHDAGVLRRKDGFIAVRRYDPSSAVRDDKAPMGFGQGFRRGVVYTPSATTLIERLGITPQEQAALNLQYLISPGERRALLAQAKKNARHAQKHAKRQALAKQVVKGLTALGPIQESQEPSVSETHLGHPVTNDLPSAHRSGSTLLQPLRKAARRHGVSVTTARRWVYQSDMGPLVQARIRNAQAARQSTARNAQASLWAMRQSMPQLTQRQLAKLIGASLSSVNRWLKLPPPQPVSLHDNSVVSCYQNHNYSNEGEADVHEAAHGQSGARASVQCMNAVPPGPRPPDAGAGTTGDITRTRTRARGAQPAGQPPVQSVDVYGRVLPYALQGTLPWPLVRLLDSGMGQQSTVVCQESIIFAYSKARPGLAQSRLVTRLTARRLRSQNPHEGLSSCDDSSTRYGLSVPDSFWQWALDHQRRSPGDVDWSQWERQLPDVSHVIGSQTLSQEVLGLFVWANVNAQTFAGGARLSLSSAIARVIANLGQPAQWRIRAQQLRAQLRIINPRAAAVLGVVVERVTLWLSLSKRTIAQIDSAKSEALV